MTNQPATQTCGECRYIPMGNAERGEAFIRLCPLHAQAAALLEALEVLDAWRKELWPFCEDGWIEGLCHLPMKDQLDWYEDTSKLFTEERLYDALGKEDARSVLGVWRRFRFITEQLRIATDAAAQPKHAAQEGGAG